MKKFLSLLALLMLCVLIAACGKTKTPEKLTETTRYEYNSEGFYVIKDCYDKKGRLLEEYYYTVDSEIYSFDCTIKAYYTYDKEGNLLKLEGHYLSNPCHATRESVLVFEAIEHETFDFKVVNEDGNIELYMKQTKNEKGQVTREEYFTRGGRFVRAEEVDYREDGTVSARRGKNARGELTYESECNEKGNFITTKLYDEYSRNVTIISAEYYENGVMSKCTTTTAFGDGTSGDPWPIAEFDETGRITQYGTSVKYYYNEDGSYGANLNSLEWYNFNAEGYLTSYRHFTNDVKVHYTYDGQGRITAAETKRDDSSESVLASITYEYRADGTVVVRTEQANNANDQMIYTDTKGRIVKTVTFRGDTRLKHETVEYDEYNNVTRICEYDKDKLEKEYLFAYNEHGDLTKEETVYHNSSSIQKTFKEYEYFENGYVKKIRSYDRQNNLDSEKVYDENLGYTCLEYVLGKKHHETTYDRYDREVKSVYYENGYASICTYEYFPDDTVKKFMLYHDDVLQSGTEYDEKGRTIKQYLRDENGVVVMTEYTYGDTEPVREDIYKDGVYAGSVLFEFFTVNTHIVKSRTELDANGQKTYYIEYREYDSYIPREEFYKDGVLVSYVTQTFVMANGSYRVDVREELKDGKIIKEDYDYGSQGKIIGHTVFENGEKVYTISYTYDDISTVLKSTTKYDVEGNVVEICEYNSNRELEAKYCYEYHPNGALKVATKWIVRSYEPDVERMVEKTIYDENGTVLSKEVYN